MSTKGTPRRRFRVAATVVAIALTGTACTGDEGPGPDAEPSTSLQEPGEAPTLEVEPVTASGRLVGRLPRKDRSRVEQAVTRVAVRWMDDAFLGGRYPRKAFGNSFAVFTGGARTAARRDLGRMTNQLIGGRVDDVTPTVVRVGVDLLAVRQRAVTATARVELRFRTEGSIERHYRVFGRLMMTRRPPGWRVFAYDIARTRLGEGGAPRAREPKQQTKPEGGKDRGPTKKKKQRKEKGERA